MEFVNPFARRDIYGRNELTTYRVLVPISWVLVVVVGIYYSVRSPVVEHGRHERGRRIFEQADRYVTAFSQSSVVTGVYWILLLLSQLGYIWNLLSRNAVQVQAAANVAGHFILSNLLTFAWILLWVRSYFWGAEIILVAHFINQHVASWRNRNNDLLPVLFVRLPALAGPYSWALTAIFWNGAIAVAVCTGVDNSSGGSGDGGESLPARILANMFIWLILVIGGTNVLVFWDYGLGYCLSFLTFSLALKQLAIRIKSLQWIFAFTIFGIFVLLSLHVSSATYYRRDALFRRPVVRPRPPFAAEPGDDEDSVVNQERDPLLSPEHV